MQECANYNFTIRKNIKLYRKQLGLSQERLSEMIDCSREHLARIENGKINIGLGYFIKLAKIFKISLDDFAGFKN